MGKRKLKALLACNPQRVCIIDTRPCDDSWQELLFAGPVEYQCRPFHKQDVKGNALVFAATGCAQINAAVAEACQRYGVFCNVADAPDAGTFIVPAHFRRGDILVALSTGGHSPALARSIRMDLETWFGERYTAIATLLGRLRPIVLAQKYPTNQNTELFRTIIASDLAEMLRQQRHDDAKQLLLHLLPEALHNSIGELLDDFA